MPGIATSAPTPWRPTRPHCSRSCRPGNALHLDLGTSEEYYGIPFTVVPADQPRVAIAYGTDGADYSDESDPGPMPIPRDVPIEGGSAADPNPASGDRHVLVVQQGDCILYELYNTVRTASGFRVSSSAQWDLKVNATRPAGWTSADAAGLPILPGLLKYDEVAAGRISHALRFTIPRVRQRIRRAREPLRPVRRRLAPALRHARAAASRTFPWTRTPATRCVILTALKTYGLMLADQGSAWYVTGTSNPRWADALDQLRAHPVRGERLRGAGERLDDDLLSTLLDQPCAADLRRPERPHTGSVARDDSPVGVELAEVVGEVGAQMDQVVAGADPCLGDRLG